jgi:luciferase-type oxidoreductase
MNAIHHSASLFAPAVAAPRALNPGFRRAFPRGRLALGLMFPVEAFAGDEPSMQGQAQLARRAEDAGFAALWIRDVPLRVPSFGDTGQVFDPWVWLGLLAARTESIALVTGSIVLPLRHPLHVAKAAASVDRLSGGRLVLGVASGDRPEEFPAFGADFETRGEAFRARFEALRAYTGAGGPVEVVPRPYADGIPLLVTGSSRQSPEWIARHADGWVTYPREPRLQERAIAQWREAAARAQPGAFLPFAQSLYIDLVADPLAAPRPIHLGYSLGREALGALLAGLERAGANHVALNLKYGSRPAPEVVEELARHVLPRFPAGTP